MNKLEKKNSGFTLIEIAVVVIILGVLAMIALPNLFSQIGRNKGQEAVHMLSMMRSGMESCGIQYNNDFSTCNDWDPINMSDPGGNFVYTWSGLGAGTYVCTATDTGGDWIKITRIDTGVTTCTTSSKYQGLC